MVPRGGQLREELFTERDVTRSNLIAEGGTAVARWCCHLPYDWPMNASSLLRHSGKVASVDHLPEVNCPFTWDFQSARRPKYKYLEPEVAEKFLNDGSVRIGTLFDFRGREHGSWRGDAGEGILRGCGTVSFELSKNTGVPEGLRGVLAPVRASNARMRFTDCHFDITSSSPDYYIFCVSKRKWRDHHARGMACIEIFNFPEFAGRISMALQRAVGANVYPLCYMSVQYRDRISDLANAERGQELAAIVKPKRYAWQAEARLLWQPRNTPISPVVLTCDSLREYCKRLS